MTARALLWLCEACARGLGADGYDAGSHAMACYPTGRESACEHCQSTAWTIRCVADEDKRRFPHGAAEVPAPAMRWPSFGAWGGAG